MMALSHPTSLKRKVLMTVDAAGGVWRYAMDLAIGLKQLDIETVFLNFGPLPTPGQVTEARSIGRLHISQAPLDWMVQDAEALDKVPRVIADTAVEEGVDLIHLNLPSQAACLEVRVPVIVVAHSCVCTWFEVVRGQAVPQDWRWHHALNRKGFDRADAVVMPSKSHAALSRRVYGPMEGVHVVYNASSSHALAAKAEEEFVLAAGRWWDDGKNGVALDKAAFHLDWPVVMAGANRGPNAQHVTLRNADHRGELCHADLMNLMQAAAIVVSPSLYEPFGLAALEAARFGTALVLSDIPTYRELWEGAALFVDPHDPSAFVDAIRNLSQDRDLRRSLGEEARKRSNTFTLPAQAQAVDRIYRQVLSRPPNLTAAE